MANLPIKDGNGSLVNLLAPGQRQTEYRRVSDAATIAAGAVSMAICNTGSNAGSVKGATLGRGETVTFDAPTGDTLDVVAYDATGTEFAISVVRVV